MSRRALLALATAAGLAAAACSGAPTAPAPDPAVAYAERVLARIAAAREAPSFTLRFNSSSCDCPPFEIDLGGVWHRVAFAGAEADDPVIVALDEAATAARAGRGPSTWQVQGSLEDALTTCARGALVVPLSPTAVVPAGPAPLR